MRTSTQIIVDAIRKNNNVVIDDHHNAGRTYDVAHVAELVKGVHTDSPRVHVVMLMEGKNFCLNPIYLDQHGIPHLSTNSVGGLVMAKEVSLPDAIAQHRKEHDPEWSGALLNPITL